MSVSDAGPSLRRVAALRALCVRLPHLPTPAEAERLRRFDALAAAPETTTDTDVDVLVTGWRHWWRSGASGPIYAMGARLTPRVLAADRWLTSFWRAARSARWAEIQARIWSCETCRIDGRVTPGARARIALDVRQQTDEPGAPLTKLLVVSLAPPFQRVATRTRARSATNDAGDAMRRFLEGTLGQSWTELVGRGLALLHSVKCAITTVDGHQNPPPSAVRACASQHLALEIGILRPAVIVTLGDMAHLAVVQALAGSDDLRPRSRRRSPDPAGAGVTVQAPWGPTSLWPARFPRGRYRPQAAQTVRRAATAARL